MSRKLRDDAKGSAMESRGKFLALVPLGAGAKRFERVCPSATSKEDARARAELGTGLVRALYAGGHEGLVGEALKQLVDAPADKVTAVLEGWQRVAGGALGGPKAPPKPPPPRGETFEAFAARWTSGELAKLYPDHVKVKRTSDDDAQRLKTHVLPHVRGVPLAAFSLAHAEAVMRGLPAELKPWTRRHVAQLIHRVLRLAVYPARIIATNPLPTGFLPKVGKGKAHGYLYPSEDAKLMAHGPTPLGLRLLFGFLAREGMRAGEACGLQWSDVDLEHGAVTLDKNKTDDPRSWSLDPGVVAALAAWKKIQPRPAPKPGEEEIDPEALPLFVDADATPFDPNRHKLAEMLRDALTAAGVKRTQLFEDTDERQQLRAHDLRATFVTLGLAAGRTESWVTDRTGHRSSQMLARYKRAARTVAELGLGVLRPLSDAIPELAERAPKDVSAPVSGDGGGRMEGDGSPAIPGPSGDDDEPRRSSKPLVGGSSPLGRARFQADLVAGLHCSSRATSYLVVYTRVRALAHRGLHRADDRADAPARLGRGRGGDSRRCGSRCARALPARPRASAHAAAARGRGPALGRVDRWPRVACGDDARAARRARAKARPDAAKRLSRRRGRRRPALWAPEHGWPLRRPAPLPALEPARAR